MCSFWTKLRALSALFNLASSTFFSVSDMAQNLVHFTKLIFVLLQQRFFITLGSVMHDEQPINAFVRKPSQFSFSIPFSDSFPIHSHADRLRRFTKYMALKGNVAGKLKNFFLPSRKYILLRWPLMIRQSNSVQSYQEGATSRGAVFRAYKVGDTTLRSSNRENSKFFSH